MAGRGVSFLSTRPATDPKLPFTTENQCKVYDALDPVASCLADLVEDTKLTRSQVQSTLMSLIAAGKVGRCRSELNWRSWLYYREA